MNMIYCLFYARLLFFFVHKFLLVLHDFVWKHGVYLTNVLGPISAIDESTTLPVQMPEF
jgi:hypothetical protein